MKRRLLGLLPWALCGITVAGLAARELSWRSKVRRVDEIERLLRDVSKAPDEDAERGALQNLATWAHERDITLGLSAYDRSTGQSVSMATAAAEAGRDTAFEVGFDTDGGRRPDRTFGLWLKNPTNIRLLMME